MRLAKLSHSLLRPAFLLTIVVALSNPVTSFAQRNASEERGSARIEEPSAEGISEQTEDLYGNADPGTPPGSGSDLAIADSSQRDPLTYESQRARIKLSLSGVLQASGVTGSWWNLSETYAPDTGYRPDRAWGEAWIKPGVTTDFKLYEDVRAYGGVSYVGSGNIAKDVFEQGNRGLYSIEDGYLGAKIGDREESSELDVSYGRQQYKIGSGMLIAVGAYNGFERGATTSFARRAWEEAGLVRWSKGLLSIDGFYLNPNELRSSDTDTRLAGAKSEVKLGTDQYVGAAFLNVFDSELPYLGAPLQIIPNGRKGLNTFHSYARWNPIEDIAPGFYFAGDYANQWNDRIDMSSNAFSGELGNQFVSMPFSPKLSYTFRSFQGDDPATTKYEKFDPLFYEGSPALWASGSNGSFSFLNSNIQAHRIFCNMNLTKQDILSFYYWHLRADQINSPIQFGQAGRVAVIGGEPQLVSGVPRSHLSDDFYVEHFRMISSNMFLTTGFAASVPGAGLRQLVTDSVSWYGGLMSFAFQY